MWFHGIHRERIPDVSRVLTLPEHIKYIKCLKRSLTGPIGLINPMKCNSVYQIQTPSISQPWKYTCKTVQVRNVKECVALVKYKFYLLWLNYNQIKIMLIQLIAKILRSQLIWPFSFKLYSISHSPTRLLVSPLNPSLRHLGLMLVYKPTEPVPTTTNITSTSSYTTEHLSFFL